MENIAELESEILDLQEEIKVGRGRVKSLQEALDWAYDENSVMGKRLQELEMYYDMEKPKMESLADSMKWDKIVELFPKITLDVLERVQYAK